ncbi:Mpo1-like protein [Qipengyuania sp. 483]
MLLLAMPAAGYFFALLAYFTVEKNCSATFTYPLRSLGADSKMWWLWLTGKLGGELRSQITADISAPRTHPSIASLGQVLLGSWSWEFLRQRDAALQQQRDGWKVPKL